MGHCRCPALTPRHFRRPHHPQPGRSRHLRPLRRPRPRRRPHSRLRRNQRLLGSTRRRTRQVLHVIVPDLRGIGRSSRPVGGYDKKNQAADIRAVVTALGYDRASVVSHDIGIMVAYAYAAIYPDKVERLVIMDAPIPGIAPWDDIIKDHRLWHFSFWGPDEDRLAAGRERIYLDRIWDDFSGDPRQPDEATRAFYAAQYAQPGAMHAGFEHFKAFAQDATDNQAFARTKLTMPVLAVGGEKSIGATEAVIMRNVATNVREAVVPGSGHWLMEENPIYTVALIRDFLKDPSAATPTP